MKIIEQQAFLEWVTPDAEAVIEKAGRVCYKSEGRIGPGTAQPFIKSILERGHGAVIEHASASIRVITDRGISHEIVRHRLFSFCQESTRYCNYSNEKFGKELSFIPPVGINSLQLMPWESAMRHAEREYFNMLEVGCTPQVARDVLPTCVKTELVITGNFREWRHFLKLRTARAAHPKMQVLAKLVQELLHSKASGVIFPLDGGD